MTMIRGNVCSMAKKESSNSEVQLRNPRVRSFIITFSLGHGNTGSGLAFCHT